MPRAHSVLRGSALLTLGRILSYGLAFVRNLILARLLTKADFALAAIFSMAMALLEISGRMSFGTQIIQSKDGDDAAFQASAHALQFIGGACSAILIVALSVPMAHVFNVPGAWWAFALLGSVPLLQGWSHLDVSRRQRHLDFLPFVLVDVLPQLLVTAAVWPLAEWLGDYRVIIWVMIGKALISSILTFLLAERPYRWNWDPTSIRAMLRFGWPLLLTGVAIFASNQLDQMLVGAAFSLDALANYTLAFSLVSIPWFVFGQGLSSVMLPLMSRSQDDLAGLTQQYRICSETAAVGGTVCLVPLIVIGEETIILLYGEKYNGSGIFISLLGAAAAIRFLRFAPAIAALAVGDTINQLYSNLGRSTNLPVALAVWLAGGSPAQIAACALVGEAVAIAISIVRLSHRQKIPVRQSLPSIGYMTILLIVIVGISFVKPIDPSLLPMATWALGALVVSATLALLMFPEVPRLFISAIRGRTTAAPTSTGKR